MGVGPLPSLGHRDRREVDTDQVGVCRAGQPQTGAAAPASEIGQYLALFQGQFGIDAVTPRVGGQGADRPGTRADDSQ
ncbi:hypothetical protein [Streptomyces sp. NPDC047024]|uniref:hypothetical protein n=1 Tax=Streptomyces sp. NPDC047024 TaxID=3155476 RepID=UPI0033F5CF54